MDVKNQKYKIQFTLSEAVIGILVIYCIIFPADKVNIKEILLFITLFVCSPAILMALKGEWRYNSFLLRFYGLVYPILVTLFSLTIGTSTLYDALSYGYVWIFLLLIPSIVVNRINILRSFIFATSVIAVMIDFIFVADILCLVSIYNNPIVLFFDSMNELQWGKGILATFGYSIFFKASPLIIFTYGYKLYNKKYFSAIFLFLALLGSGTRANLCVGIAMTIAIPLVCTEKASKKLILRIRTQ